METVKKAVMTGLGDGYFQAMETEETTKEGPQYATEVYSVPSLQSAETEVTYESSPLFLSNKRHSELGRISGATITLNAAYLPDGFAEEMTGAVKLGPGAYAYNDKPAQKFFRFAFPVTDEHGGEVIVNFPKCQLEPVGISAQTETESKEGQVNAFNIVANALNYQPGEADGNNSVYLTVDLRDEEAAEQYDRDKLLENGWYGKTTLEQAKKISAPAEDISPTDGEDDQSLGEDDAIV